MTFRKLAVGAALAALMAGASTAALAQDQITIYSNSYRTGPFSGSGIPVANGIGDYMAMLNERDGGIGGAKINWVECETGYDTKKSVECYEQGKAQGSVLYLPWSTGATLAAIPRAHVDKIPILSMAYGLSAAADGKNFPWVFNPPLTYWDGAQVFLQHAAQKEGGGLDKLKGKKIGLIHLDAPYGKEPIPILENLAKKHGFELLLYPIPAKEMQNQGSVWLNIRRDRPDWILLQGWGAMNPTAVKEAAKNNFPMDRMVGIWWAGGDDDARAGAAEAKGYKSISWHQVGANFPVIQDIIKHVVDKGKSQTEKGKVGEALYNRTVYQGIILAEAIRNAQKLSGKKVITGEDLRRGLESLTISEARWAELGAPGFASPLKITCDDHSGHHAAFIIEWDGAKWVKASDPIVPDKSVVRPLMLEAAQDYVSKNAGWPQRTEPCDARS
jgi:branched-chain amino acid transport system substrate-binding protein